MLILTIKRTFVNRFNKTNEKNYRDFKNPGTDALCPGSHVPYFSDFYRSLWYCAACSLPAAAASFASRFPFLINSLAIQLDKKVFPNPELPINNKFFSFMLSKLAIKLSEIFLIILIFSRGDMLELYFSLSIFEE